MYVAWTLIYLGVSLTLNTVWLLSLLPLLGECQKDGVTACWPEKLSRCGLAERNRQ